MPYFTVEQPDPELEITELTIDQIAEKFGKKPEEIRIKKDESNK
jgi:hypothetical protein